MNTTSDEKTISEIQNAQTLLCYYRNDNTHSNISVAEYISKQIKSKKPIAKILYIDTQKKHNGYYETSYEYDYLEAVDFLISNKGIANEKNVELFTEKIKEYDHIILDDLDALIFIHVSDNPEQIRFKRTALIELLDKLKFNPDIDTTASVLSSKKDSKNLFESLKMPHNGRLFVDFATLDTPLPEEAQSSSTPDNFFDEADTENMPSTGVYRMDHILAQNKAQWGDMVFFATQEGVQLTQYAIDSMIPNAPIHTLLLHITPFRTQKEVKRSLQKLDAIAPLSKQAVKRTVFISSENFRNTTLDSKDALMSIIKESIVDFRKRLDSMKLEHGICLIDAVTIDKYGAELDYPSLRWYAKSNDILIIIGADKAEERYTFQRKTLENNPLKSKKPQLTHTT